MIKAIIFDWIGVLSAGGNGGIYPFSESVLKKLKTSHKIGLVSLAGFGKEKRIKDINESGLEPYFDSIVVDTKKEPKHYLKCMNDMGITPLQTLIVDDRTVMGIKIGNELNCQTCWVMEDGYLHEVPNEETGEPTYRIRSVEDLLNIL